MQVVEIKNMERILCNDEFPGHLELNIDTTHPAHYSTVMKYRP